MKFESLEWVVTVAGPRRVHRRRARQAGRDAAGDGTRGPDGPGGQALGSIGGDGPQLPISKAKETSNMKRHTNRQIINDDEDHHQEAGKFDLSFFN